MPAILSFLRRYQIHLWTAASLAAVIAVVVLSLDTTFKVRKKELIIQHKQQEFDSDPLLNQAKTGGTTVAATGLYTEEERASLRRLYDAVIEADNTIYRISFSIGDGEPWVDTSDPAKYKRLNTLSNSLFSRDFSSYIYTPHRRQGEVVANTKLYYTSAPVQEIPGLGSLLAQYRLWAVLAFVALVYLYALIFRKVLQPVTRVTTALERSTDGPAVLIEDATEPLELAYNRLARNRKLVEVTGELDDLASVMPTSASEARDPVQPFLPDALDRIRRVMGYGQVVVFRRLAEEGALRIERIAPPSGEDGAEGRAFPLATLEVAAEARRAVLRFPEELDASLREALSWDAPVAVVPLEVGSERLGVVAFRDVLDRPLRPGDLEEIGRVCDALGNAMTKVVNRQYMIERERHAVTGTLATNLGHDLTNIIATGKWDLQTLQEALRRGVLSADPGSRDSIHSAMDGLLSNMTLLQEMVNIYRAYGHAERPVYEPVDPNSIVTVMRDLFLLSTSRNLRVEIDCADDVPVCELEVRLLKVALFNLLTNAARAVGEADPRGEHTATILLRTRLLPSGDVEIAVLDEGTGFRDKHGQLLHEWEIQREMRFGFSTKADSSGGLGLPWVRTIIEDFHQGTVRAANRPEGGAVVSLQFAPHDPRRQSAARPTHLRL